MGETALGPGETSREIGEHAHHGHGRGGSRHDRIMAIVEAALLAVVALLAAWSGFAAAKWSTESRLTTDDAATARTQASTAELEGLDARLGDAGVFETWLQAKAVGNVDAQRVAERRFRPELKVAFDAWLATDPYANPAAPAGPQAMPEYVAPDVGRAEELHARADELHRRGSEQGQTADDYVRITVYLATVLFLVGLSTHFPVRTARYGLLGIAGIVLVYSVVQLLSSPPPPG